MSFLKIIFIPFVIAIICGIAVVGLYRVKSIYDLKKTPFQKLSSQFAAKPPEESRNAKLISLGGVVAKWDRFTKEKVIITSENIVLQGESVETDASGAATLEFLSGHRLAVQPKTNISLVESLPAKVLIEQREGSVTYQTISDKPLLSVRSLSLLAQISSGSATVAFDQSNRIRIAVHDGEVTLAYQDGEKNTVITTLAKDGYATYDHKKRRLLYK